MKNAIFATSIALALAASLFQPANARPHATPTPEPTPTPVADPAVTKLARQQFVAWQAGSVNKTLYTPTLAGKITDEKVLDVSHQLGQLGPLTDTVYIGPFTASDVPPDAHGYIYLMKCTSGNIYVQMILDAQGKIATIFFRNRLETETIEAPPSGNPL